MHIYQNVWTALQLFFGHGYNAQSGIPRNQMNQESQESILKEV